MSKHRRCRSLRIELATQRVRMAADMGGVLPFSTHEVLCIAVQKAPLGMTRSAHGILEPARPDGCSLQLLAVSSRWTCQSMVPVGRFKGAPCTWQLSSTSTVAPSPTAMSPQSNPASSARARNGKRLMKADRKRRQLEHAGGRRNTCEGAAEGGRSIPKFLLEMVCCSRTHSEHLFC